jgi:hypothetical protein
MVTQMPLLHGYDNCLMLLTHYYVEHAMQCEDIADQHRHIYSFRQGAGIIALLEKPISPIEDPIYIDFLADLLEYQAVELSLLYSTEYGISIRFGTLYSSK